MKVVSGKSKFLNKPFGTSSILSKSAKRKRFFYGIIFSKSFRTIIRVVNLLNEKGSFLAYRRGRLIGGLATLAITNGHGGVGARSAWSPAVSHLFSLGVHHAERPSLLFSPGPPRPPRC